jgi:hypothetical protein
MGAARPGKAAHCSGDGLERARNILRDHASAGGATGGDVSLKNLLMCDDALRRRDEGDFPALARLMASRRGRVVIIRDVLASSSLALVLSSGASYSGPCTQQISDVRDTQSKLLSEIAGAGPAGKESTGATMHRQPTPSSLAQAEGRPEKNVEAFEQAMDRAVKADETDNLAECEKALTEARRILDQAKR